MSFILWSYILWMDNFFTSETLRLWRELIFGADRAPDINCSGGKEDGNVLFLIIIYLHSLALPQRIVCIFLLTQVSYCRHVCFLQASYLFDPGSRIPSTIRHYQQRYFAESR